jgi:outer membrane protein OmpA-like peptidoglycan-associated protein
VMGSAGAVREDAMAFVVTLGGGAFATGAATLSPAARAELRVLATVLAGYPGHIISVEGHSDNVGNAAANQRLSQERAAAVRAGLIVEGVDPLWIGSIGWGVVQPVATNATAAGRAANRRVEIFIDRRQCRTAPVPAPDGRPSCPP